jgi:hypothetical protein
LLLLLLLLLLCNRGLENELDFDTVGGKNDDEIDVDDCSFVARVDVDIIGKAVDGCIVATSAKDVNTNESVRRAMPALRCISVLLDFVVILIDSTLTPAFSRVSPFSFLIHDDNYLMVVVQLTI